MGADADADSCSRHVDLINLPRRATANKGARDKGIRRSQARDKEKQEQLHSVGIEWITKNERVPTGGLGSTRSQKRTTVEKKDPTSKFKVKTVTQKAACGRQQYGLRIMF